MAGPEELEESWADKPLPNTRHGARQLALQALYWEASAAGEAGLALQELSRRTSLSAELAAFAVALVEAVAAHRTELDGLIGEASSHWRQERIARLDGLILRLALVEMLHFADIPVRVAIDEAVELAKTYGGEQSYVFVNGVLDAVVRRQGLTV